MPPKYQSKYNQYFVINHETKSAKCKTCNDVLRKNCSGMKKHMRVKHSIIVENEVMEEETEIQSPSKKHKMDGKVVEPIEDQICREAAKEGASFR